MKVQNTPASYGFLAGAIVLLLGLVANASCTPLVRGRDPGIAFESTVTIEATCIAGDKYVGSYYGSGVIVNETTILTAAHVALDPDGITCVRTAKMVHGKTFLLSAGKALPDRDLASLKLLTGKFDPTFPVFFGPVPSYGSRVCAMTGFPRVLWRCGEVQIGQDPPGDLSHTIIVEPGNSGSGVYDERGRLVGIITHRWSCSNGQICGGKMATLDGYVKDLL